MILKKKEAKMEKSKSMKFYIKRKKRLMTFKINTKKKKFKLKKK